MAPLRAKRWLRPLRANWRILIGVGGIVLGKQDFVQLLTGSPPDYLDTATLSGRVQGFGQVNNADGRHPGDVRLPAFGRTERQQHKLDCGVGRDPEARHAHIGKRQALVALREQAAEVRQHRAAAAQHIAVAHHREARRAPAADIRTRSDKQAVGDHLSGAVQVHRVDGLVGRERKHLLHAVVECGINDVLRTVDVVLDCLKRVVLTRTHLLHRSRMHDDIDTFGCAQQARAVAYIADKEAQPCGLLLHLLRHHELLVLIARVDDQAGHLALLEDMLRKELAKGAGPACKEYRLALKWVHCPALIWGLRALRPKRWVRPLRWLRGGMSLAQAALGPLPIGLHIQPEAEVDDIMWRTLDDWQHQMDAKPQCQGSA